jgi:hypothetical protein
VIARSVVSFISVDGPRKRKSVACFTSRRGGFGWGGVSILIGSRAFVDRWLRVKPRSKAINAPIVATGARARRGVD